MPNIDENLAFAPASELRELIAGKQVSSVELTALYYERIDRLDSQLHAYLTLCRDEAMQAARDAESAVMRGDDLGALHGVPISIKDLELTKGVRTTSGSLVFKDRIPDEDSIVVERVKASGAIVLGKTNTPEFGHRGIRLRINLATPVVTRGMRSVLRAVQAVVRLPRWRRGCAPYRLEATAADRSEYLRVSAGCTASSRRRGVCHDMVVALPLPLRTS